jgi:NDP-sugar pyrophosphorylase family protein
MKNNFSIIITMAGASKRFFDAGFKEPKYMLDLNGKTLFSHVLSSFESYFDKAEFVFIIRNINQTHSFIQKECKLLKIKNYKLSTLNLLTTGQADTLYQGLELINFNKEKSIMVFNIDTIIKKFVLPHSFFEYDGYLQVFKGSGKNWSYVKPLNKASTKVIETAEKKEISNLCSTGLYYFKNYNLFRQAFLNNQIIDDRLKERYIAPLYNTLIKNGLNINYQLTERKNISLCGTPEEYNELLKKFN